MAKKLGELMPDVALSQLLDNIVRVNTSATDSHSIRCYCDTLKPTNKLAEEFLDVMVNGGIESRVGCLGLWEGVLLLSVYVKLLPDNTCNHARVRQILSQCQDLIHRKTADGYFFEFDFEQTVMPTTPNPQSGYSATILNINWHTINI